MNQAEIAQAIGLTRASIANIETGRQRIPLHHLYSLARALKVDVYALLPTAVGAPMVADREIQSSIELSAREQDNVARVVGSIEVRTTHRRKP